MGYFRNATSLGQRKQQINISTLKPFVFKPCYEIINSNSFFLNNYQRFGRAVETNNTNEVFATLLEASKSPLMLFEKQILSEGYLYLSFRLKDTLLNDRSNCPFDTLFSYDYTSTFECLTNSGSGMYRIKDMISKGIKREKCVLANRNFVQSYLDSLSISLSNSADMNKCTDLISTCYAGLFSASLLMNNYGNAIRNVEKCSAVELMGIIHVLSIPLLEYFSFPDGFEESDYHKELLKCANLISYCCSVGSSDNRLTLEYCSNCINLLLDKINLLSDLGIPNQNNQILGSIKNSLMKWSHNYGRY